MHTHGEYGHDHDGGELPHKHDDLIAIEEEEIVIPQDNIDYGDVINNSGAEEVKDVAEAAIVALKEVAEAAIVADVVEEVIEEGEEEEEEEEDIIPQAEEEEIIILEEEDGGEDGGKEELRDKPRSRRSFG